MKNDTTRKIVLTALVALATAATADAGQNSRKNAKHLGTGASIPEAGTYSPGKTVTRNTPSVGVAPGADRWTIESDGERKKGSKGRNWNPLPGAGTQAATSEIGTDPRPVLCTDRCAYVELPGILYDPMDLNRDGIVDDDDFLWLCKAFGTEEGDLNEDGITDGLDLGLMLVRLANQVQIED